ncbi:hypothetical protein ACFSTC_22665 [Nonomuraea ferruginea]
MTIMPLLVALVVAPLLALALDRGGAWVRRAGRILLSLSLVTFSSAAVAVSWLRGLRPDAEGLTAMARSLAEPATAPGTLRLIVAAATFGVVCALAVLAFLPALRGGTVTPAMLAVAGIVALATVAAGLQLFTLGLVLTGGGPRDSTQTLALLQYTFTWRAARLGMGAAIATLTGVILGVLGIAATILAIATRMRLTVTPRHRSGRGSLRAGFRGGPRQSVLPGPAAGRRARDRAVRPAAGRGRPVRRRAPSGQPVRAGHPVRDRGREAGHRPEALGGGHGRRGGRAARGDGSRLPVELALAVGPSPAAWRRARPTGGTCT